MIHCLRALYALIRWCGLAFLAYFCIVQGAPFLQPADDASASEPPKARVPVCSRPATAPPAVRPASTGTLVTFTVLPQVVVQLDAGDQPAAVRTNSCRRPRITDRWTALDRQGGQNSTVGSGVRQQVVALTSALPDEAFDDPALVVPLR